MKKKCEVQSAECRVQDEKWEAACHALHVFLVVAVIEKGDMKARRVLYNTWPGEDWDGHVARLVARFYTWHQGGWRLYRGPELQLTWRGAEYLVNDSSRTKKVHLATGARPVCGGGRGGKKAQYQVDIGPGNCRRCEQLGKRATTNHTKGTKI
jgi:hypothetical protein